MPSLDDLLDNYLSGNTGPLLDPSVGAGDVKPGPATLHGIAQDSASGAVVVDDDGLVTLVLGLEAWPEELFGQRVEVHGELGTVATPGGGGLDAEGLAWHGASGGASRAIASATWKKA
ncbi:MAG: hypothetical protein RIT45_4409 [Pseudomonadota bacterium]|jgi:hypothetical protein